MNLHWLLLSLKNGITYELGQRASGRCIFIYLLHFWFNEETLISYIPVFYRELKWFCSETTGSYNSKSVWFWRKNFLFTGSWLVTENMLGLYCKKEVKLLNTISFKILLRHCMSLYRHFLLTWERTWYSANLYWTCLCVQKWLTWICLLLVFLMLTSILLS